MKRARKAKQKDAPKILTLDLELSPITAYVWQLFDVTVGLDQIINDWSVLMFCAKWSDGKQVICRDTSGRGAAKVKDDRELLRELSELLDRADIVVGHNVNKFDLKKVGARMIGHGMKPFSPVRSIDTLLLAKKAGAFTSAKLAFLAEQLTERRKDTHAKYPGMNLWKAVLGDDLGAWQAMRKYCRDDVLATESLYEKLKPWAAGPNLSVYADGNDVITCPTCMSPNIQTRGICVTQAGKFRRVHCQSCGSWSRAKQNLVPADTRKKILTKV